MTSFDMKELWLEGRRAKNFDYLRIGKFWEGLKGLAENDLGN